MLLDAASLQRPKQCMNQYQSLAFPLESFRETTDGAEDDVNMQTGQMPDTNLLLEWEGSEDASWSLVTGHPI